MQSSLKKSLYLGLAALSFASVASVTSATSANAAKKHSHKRVAKKVTYKTTNKNLDQSVVFKATGKNAVYNKAVGKRSVIASLSDMKSKANSKNTNDLFMAYQEGVTSKGVHYYKVVSFDKKVRGFVYNKGVAKVDNSQNVATPNNATGYLQKTDRFFNQAYGSQFHNNGLKHTYDGMNIAADQFTVSKAVKVNDNQTYYYVTDKNNQLVNGWVNSVYFSNTVTPAAQKAIDASQAVNVTFVNGNRLGSVASTAKVNIAMNKENLAKSTNSADQNYYFTNKALNDAIEKQIKATGVSFNKNQADNAKYFTTNGDNAASNVKPGDNVTFVVNSDDSKSASRFNLNFLQSDNGFYLGNKGQGVDLKQAKFAGSVTNALFDSVAKGTPNQAFNFNAFKSALLDNNAPLHSYNIGGTVYAIDPVTFTVQGNPAIYNNDGSVKQNIDFNDVKNGLNLYYTKVSTNNNAAQQNNSDVNFANLNVDTHNADQPKTDNNNVTLKSDFLNKVSQLAKEGSIRNVVVKKETNNNIAGNIGLHYTTKNGVNKFDNITSDMSVLNWKSNKSDYSALPGATLTPSDEDSIRAAMDGNTKLNTINIDNNGQAKDANGDIVNFG